MRKLFLNIKNGRFVIKDIPIGSVSSNKIVVKNKYSLISKGTEFKLINFGKKNIVSKIISYQEYFWKVYYSFRLNGFLQTIFSIQNKIGTLKPLGYSSVGEVVNVGNNVKEFEVGDIIACDAPHAEYALVSPAFAVKLADGVTPKNAAFVPIGAIAINAIKLLSPNKNEAVIVYGMGLIGIIVCKILHSKGCKVLVVENNLDRLQIAKENGFASITEKELVRLSQSLDELYSGSIITSHVGNSINQLLAVQKRNSKIIVIGDGEIKFDRKDAYRKEIWVCVSSSLGVDRYDIDSIENHNYNIFDDKATVKNNMKDFLTMLEGNEINLDDIPICYESFDNILSIYEKLNKNSAYFTGLISYEHRVEEKVEMNKEPISEGSKYTGVIGAGNYVKTNLLHNLNNNQYTVHSICSLKGENATFLSEKYKIPNVFTDYNLVLEDKKINQLFICTRHNLREEIILKALKRDIDVFVEKPLTIDRNSLRKIIEAKKESKSTLNVGFNRRFSGFSNHIKKHCLIDDQPMQIVMIVNAEKLDSNSWVLHKDIGGGRILGEIGHFLDLAVFFSNSKIGKVNAISLEDNKAHTSNDVNVTLTFQNGSTATIVYSTKGAVSYVKEKITIIQSGGIFEIENFKKLKIFGNTTRTKSLWMRDKGHKEQFKLLKGDKGLNQIIPLEDIYNVSISTFAIIESIDLGKEILISNK